MDALQHCIYVGGLGDAVLWAVLCDVALGWLGMHGWAMTW